MSKKRKKIKFSISGKTVDGKLVVGGVYDITETYGVPLDMLLITLDESDLVIDWIDYYETALKSGMKSDRILERIKYNIRDIYGVDYSKYVITTLKYHIKRVREVI